MARERYMLLIINRSNGRGRGREVYVRKMNTDMEMHKPRSEVWRKQLQESEMKEKQKCHLGTTSETS